MTQILQGWGKWRPREGDETLAQRGHGYDLVVDFALDDQVDSGVALIADRMADALEEHVLPGLRMQGASGRIDLAYVSGLGGATGRYIPGTWRTPVIVLDLGVIVAEDDPIAALAMAFAQAVGQAWRDAHHGRVDVDAQALISADAYRTLISASAPWRGSSMPAGT